MIVHGGDIAGAGLQQDSRTVLSCLSPKEQAGAEHAWQQSQRRSGQPVCLKSMAGYTVSGREFCMPTGERIMATYTCNMAVNATRAHCDAPLDNSDLTKADGGSVQVSRCTHGHGQTESPLCCGEDMRCEMKLALCRRGGSPTQSRAQGVERSEMRDAPLTRADFCGRFNRAANDCMRVSRWCTHPNEVQ